MILLFLMIFSTLCLTILIVTIPIVTILVISTLQPQCRAIANKAMSSFVTFLLSNIPKLQGISKLLHWPSWIRRRLMDNLSPPGKFDNTDNLTPRFTTLNCPGVKLCWSKIVLVLNCAGVKLSWC